jgi:prolyl 4-hydroxylase
MVVEIKNILTSDQSKELIEIAEKSLTQMTTLGKQIDGYRTAEGTWLSKDLDITKTIMSIVSEYTNLPIDNMEDLHIVRYEIGGEYKQHHDFFFSNQDYYESVCTNRGGQRLKSTLFYLNDDFEGGETHFPKLNKMIKPEANKMIIWDNVNKDGSLDYDSLHAGLPVKSGVKYIGIIWIRENKFV